MTNQPAVHSLSQEWRQAGVQEGDILLLHSSTRRTLKRLPSLGCMPDPEVILDSFLHALGASGTLLLPLFNFEFTSGKPFDIRNTPSHMGSLTETGRKRAGVVRTGHPVYSFGVLGNGKELFRRINNFSGYGRDSPFAILHRSGGKIAVLDLPDQHSMTFYHYVEESLNVDYRFHKEFSGSYTDLSGNTSIRSYGIFVRKVDDGVVTHVDPMGELLWTKGLYSGHRPGSGSGLRVIRSQAMYNEVANVISAGKARGLLYEIQ